MTDHPKPPVIIDGERIQLRARSTNQASEMYSLINENREHLKPWMPWEETTKKLEDSLAYLELAMGWWQAGKTYDFSIFEKNTGRMVGSFGLHSLNWMNKTCEIGYWIGAKDQGKGFIPEAVRLGEKIAQDLGFHRLVITCDRLNQRSQNVPLRLGYIPEAVLIDDSIDRGKFRDSCQFVKLINQKIEGQHTENLPDGFSIKDCEADEFWKTVGDQIERVFDDNGLILRVREVITDKERDQLKALNENFKHQYMLHSLILYRGELAGWTWGFQDSRESFYMVNSAILPVHRGRGLYSRLLEVTLKKLINKGFQRIWSRHSMTNNEIIVPKLKRGFYMTGTELSDVFGPLIHLSYYTNRIRKKVLNFRAGQLRPDQELKEIFKI